MIQHVANLVGEAPLHRVVRAVHRVDPRSKSLAAVDHEQTTATRLDAPAHQQRQQLLARRRVLAGAANHPQHVLVTLAVHANDADHVVVGESQTIQVNNQNVLRSASGTTPA